MSKKHLLFGLALSSLLLFACLAIWRQASQDDGDPISAANYRRLGVGIEKQEVVAILGKDFEIYLMSHLKRSTMYWRGVRGEIFVHLDANDRLEDSSICLFGDNPGLPTFWQLLQKVTK